MNTVPIVQRTFTEKQCFSAAYDLIQAVIDIKSGWPEGAGYPSILRDPQIGHLITRLETWTDWLVARDGGL